MGKRLIRGTKRFLVNSALMLLGLAVALMIGEVIARWTGAVGEEFLYHNEPVLLRKYRPGARGWAFHSEFKTWVEINHEGFRSPEISVTKSPGMRRIVVLGDSFTAAMEVSLEQTFHQSLTRFLPKPLQVISLGVSSYSTAQSYLALKKYGLKYKPDLVILAFYIGNDLTDNSPEFSTTLPHPYFRLDEEGELRLLPTPRRQRRLRDWLNTHSVLYRWQKEAFARLRDRFKRKRRVNNRGYEFYHRQWTPRCQRTWELTKALIRSTRQEAEAHNAKFLLMLVPALEQVHDPLWRQICKETPSLRKTDLDREKPNRALRAFAEQEGIACLDLYPAFREDYQNRDAGYYLVNWRHLTSAGHDRTARLLAQKIRHLKLLSSMP